MSLKIPNKYKQIYNTLDICEATKKVALSATEWANAYHKKHGEPVLVVSILQGGAFFFSDLVRMVAAPLNVGFLMARSYASNEVQEPVTIVHTDFDPKGRAVLLVDDIYDSGETITFIKDVLLNEQEAAEVKSAVLIYRNLVNHDNSSPDWYGLEYKGEEWFVGYGMDDNGLFRNLSSIYVIDREG